MFLVPFIEWPHTGKSPCPSGVEGMSKLRGVETRDGM